jgi:hypothetical protein
MVYILKNYLMRQKGIVETSIKIELTAIQKEATDAHS